MAVTPEQIEKAKARGVILARQAELKNQAIAEGTYVDEEDEEEEPQELDIEFNEQCFLLAFIEPLIAKKVREDNQAKSKKYLPYSPDRGVNAPLVVDGQPYGFINRMTANSNQATFFNMQTKDLSRLQPSIRLFKVEEKDGRDVETEMTFASYFTSPSHPGPHEHRHTDLDFTRTKQSRGAGVGLQSFDFAYEGQDPFAVQRSISAKMTIFAQSFDELLRDRVASNGERYKYADLALKTGGASIQELEKLDGASDAQKQEIATNLKNLRFRLKAVVGWAVPKGGILGFGSGTYWDDTGEKGIHRNDLLDAIYDSFISINLTPTTHRFNIDDYGRVRYEQNYLAYVEDNFNRSQYNIFADPDIAKRIADRASDLARYTQACGSDESTDWKKETKYAENQVKDKQEAFRTLIAKLAGPPASEEDAEEAGSTERKINFIHLAYEDFLAFNTEAQYLKGWGDEASRTEYVEDLQTQTAEALDPDPPKSEEGGISETLLDRFSTQSKDDPEIYNIGYFYITDLMDIILKGIDDALKATSEEPGGDKNAYNNFKKFRLGLGPVEITNVKMVGSKSTIAPNVSLGDIPISVKYFMEWLTKKMLKKDEAIYPLATFCTDFFNEFVTNFLTDDKCFGGDVKQAVKLGQAAITAYSPNPQVDQLTSRATPGRRVNSNPMDILNVSGERGMPNPNPGPDGQFDYLVYYVSRVQPPDYLLGDREMDEKSGIFHYGIGKDRGVVKTINFQATPSPYLKEVRFVQEGYDGLKQLREVYDVNIKSYANVNAYPGQYLYVDYQTFSPAGMTNLSELGIGGYHMITRSEHSFGPGKAETTLVARWVAQRWNNTEEARASIPADDTLTPADVPLDVEGACKTQGSDASTRAGLGTGAALDELATSLEDKP